MFQPYKIPFRDFIVSVVRLPEIPGEPSFIEAMLFAKEGHEDLCGDFFIRIPADNKFLLESLRENLRSMQQYNYSYPLSPKGLMKELSWIHAWIR